MGTIAEKLTYLSDTKDKLKDSINNLGGSITNETTFRAYAEELDNIYSNIPKTAYQEGSNLSFSSIKGKVDVDRIEGDTTQDSTTGKNKLQLNSGTYSNNGITITIADDGLITINGTASATTNFTGVGTFAYTTGTTYIGNCIYLSGTCTDYGGGIFFNKTSATGTSNDGGGAGFRTSTSRTFTINSDEASKTYYAYITITSGNTFTNYKTYLQIVTGSTADYNYEPYTNGASPNPTYPQDISVVTGEQEVVVQNANYFKPQLKVNGTDITQVRCSVTLQDDEYIFVASGNDMYLGNVGTSGTSYGNNRGTLIKLPTNASKVYVTTTNTDFNANYICWYDENKTTLGFVLSNSAGNSIPSGAKYTNVRIGKADSVSGTTYKTKVMVRIDDSTTTYVEHQEQNYTINLGDIELSKIGNYIDNLFETSGKNLFDKSNYTKGSYFNSNGELVSGANWGYTYVPCEPNTTYTASGMKNYSTPSFIEVDENKNFIANLFNKTGESSKTFTTTTGKYIGVSFVWNNSASNGGEIDTLMINEDSSALPYEPYGSGKWYIEKNYEKITLANYTWLQNTTSTTGKNRYYTNGLTSIIEKTATNGTKTTKGLLCNILTESTPNNNYLCTDNSICSTPNGQTYVYIESISGETGTTALMNLLTNTNAYALIPLATTTYEEITNETLIEELNEIKKMMSYNGQTNINISGNLPMLLKARTLKGE